jgi:hypothetical protein
MEKQESKIRFPTFPQPLRLRTITSYEIRILRARSKGFLLLDGHLRLAILKELGAVEAKSLLATEEDGYTYNKRVNYIPPVAQHLMLLQALNRGVSRGTDRHSAKCGCLCSSAESADARWHLRRSRGNVARSQNEPGALPGIAKDEASHPNCHSGVNDPPK